MAQIGVVGLGVMGLGIAQVFAAAGHNVVAFDQDQASRDSAQARIAAQIAPRVAAGKLAQHEAKAIVSRTTVADRLEDMAAADLVIEAIVESLAPKQALFQRLEAASSAVLATNTSSLGIGAIAAGLAQPQRLIGLHFFNPAPAMKLVELVRHPGSDPDVLAFAHDLTTAAGKTVIACADRPGFIVNRCARPYYGEALAMMEKGRTPQDIDAAMVAAGYPMGPFALIDLIGVDTHLAATEGIFDAMNHHPRYHVFDALRQQLATGDLGRKTGKGFVFPGAPGVVPVDAEAIRLRIEAMLVNEAASLVAEGDVSPENIDLAMTLALRFPRGPFAAAKAWGPDRILAALDTEVANAPAPMKQRYVPAPGLVSLIGSLSK
jgi:3-hydroxybutyryl-CoA dehydrogenase